MDIKNIKPKIESIISKYKYAVLVFIIGIVLMLLPGKSNPQSEADSLKPMNIIQQTASVQEQLEHILSHIQGAGNVKVMLTEASGEKTIYQMNEDSTISESASSKNSEVTIVTDADRNEIGLIQQINPPQYLGAIILCQGADDPALKLAICHAVSKITGLGTDRIAELKMK